MRTVQIGIVGCGWFGNTHLDTLLHTPGVEVAALATGNVERLRQTGQKAPAARQYLTAREMFEKEALDAAVLCVTPERHGELERDAARRGIHLYVEKPVGLSLPQVRETARVLREAGVLAAVGYQQRYSPALQEIKAVVAEKQVGLASGRWIGFPAPAPWWRRKEQSGGQLVEQATHIVDALRYLLGEVEMVYSAGRTGFAGLEGGNVEDYSTTILQFQSGAQACLQAGCYLQSGLEGDVGFELFCKDMRIQYRWSKEARFIAPQEERTVKAPNNLQVTALQSFVEAVRNGDASLLQSTYEDAVETLRVTLAANRSMETGAPVLLEQVT